MQLHLMYDSEWKRLSCLYRMQHLKLKTFRQFKAPSFLINNSQRRLNKITRELRKRERQLNQTYWDEEHNKFIIEKALSQQKPL